MFTGIVHEVGRVEAVEPAETAVRLSIRAPETAARASVGDSVAVCGVCLTAVEAVDGVLAFEAVAETLRRSSLGRLVPGAAVNIEPSLRAGDQLGGHFVQGHVDGVGRVRRADADGLEIEAPAAVLRYCVEKGSVTVEGVSLTISGLSDDSFSVALIPHTRDVTTLGGLRHGDEVNIETDVIARHVERLLQR